MALTREDKIKWAVGSIAGLLLTALAATFFFVEICDQQLTRNGSVVTVCRHASAADPPVVAVGLAVVALLAVLFAEVSVLGLTVKGQFRRTQEQVRENEFTSQELSDDMRELQSDLYEALNQVRALLPPDEEPPPPAVDAIEELAREYNRIRHEMPSGTERTNAMTDIVRRLTDEIQQRQGFDPAPYLESADRGLRLAGYAALYAGGNPSFIPRLATAVTEEDKPFGQYWALQALDKQLRYAPRALDSASADLLEHHLRDIPYREDRARRIREILLRERGRIL
ncbi:hypothetical protein G5C51_09620 [Streptomyces sp. A7024]|uniref:Uncharacterized protein n=1 Tax=Streptomyces coryli TaxID=1128680 RepID=A0A6G4TYT8_9ACTN|nr:hypothetical protein [Streptomyces coryli]NGN64161.1 hypothetical protein [Streptomyces coryli]